MSVSFEIRELSIVILAKNHNPTILNPDFLKYNNIVGNDWDLQESPICVEPLAQVFFKNKVKIISQRDKIVFSENITDKEIEGVLIPDISYKYTKTLPHVEYTAIGINPKGHLVIQGGQDECQKFITEKFIRSGPWQNFGDSPVKTNIKFTYTLENLTCNVDIGETFFKSSDEKLIPVIGFGANLHRQLVGNDRNERLMDLHKIIKKWKKDLDLYKDLIKNILGGENE